MAKCIIDDSDWQDTFPTEPDTLWWFYGWTSEFGIRNFPKPK